MTITSQDYINMITLLLMYFIAGWILIGICALTVKHFWHDSMNDNQEVNVIADYKQTRKTA